MSERHHVYDGKSPERMETWAKGIGEEVLQAVRNILVRTRYPEQAYCSCMGILSLAKKHGSERVNTVTPSI